MTNDMAEYIKKLPKVELHLHLDGAIRFSTLLELSQKKRIDLNGAQTVEEIKKVVCTNTPSTLVHVLSAFDLFLPCVIGDAEAIERIAYELCEDQFEQNVIYFEARYSPHLLSNRVHHNHIETDNKLLSELTSEEVVQAINRGLSRGQRDFGVKARSILCAIETYEQYIDDLLKLAIRFKEEGVVGIDVAGCSAGTSEKYRTRVVNLFHEAKKLGINRTAHAGESNGAECVKQVIEEMEVLRVGHGYRIVEDEKIYSKYALPSSPHAKVHFEACPYSSVMTGAVLPAWNKHPLIRWVKDGVNFSISRDDPTCFDNVMTGELTLTMLKMGLSLEDLKKSQLNAARAAFLPENEKSELITTLEKAFSTIP